MQGWCVRDGVWRDGVLGDGVDGVYRGVCRNGVYSAPPLLQEFFLAVKDILRRHPPGVGGYTKWRREEKELNTK